MNIDRIAKLMCLSAALLLPLLGCGGGDTAPSPSPAASKDDGGKAVVTALPTPTPTAEPLYGEPNDSGDITISSEILRELTPLTLTLTTEDVILIYHTHAREAYRQDETYSYTETEEGSYRTTEYDKSVVAAGDALTEALTNLGYTVIHDPTDVEEPELRSAYSRSLVVMESHPEATVFIDLHRNAARVPQKNDDVVILNSERCAKLFFVVGTGIGTYFGEYDKAPAWWDNYRVALALTEKLQAYDPDLALPIRTKAGRYNQQLGKLCLLIELGHNANTFSDVLHSIPWLVKAFTAVLPLDGEAELS